jgi:hypothetical protein
VFAFNGNIIQVFDEMKMKSRIFVPLRERIPELLIDFISARMTRLTHVNIQIFILQEMIVNILSCGKVPYVPKPH